MAQKNPQHQVQMWRQAHEHRILKGLMEFVAIPCVTADSAGIHRNAAFILQEMKAAGIENVQLMTSEKPGARPAVFGEVKVPKAKQTIAFYAHYDGQPVNPMHWAAGLSPFRPQLLTAKLEQGGKFIDLPDASQPILPDWRLYGRASADDKMGVWAVIYAYRALRELGITPSVNLKFFFEGEEEAGSPHLSEILEKYKNLLTADLWIIADGPLHQSGLKQIVFGVRGDVNMELTVYGPKRPLHSGHYGNWVHNPAMLLAKLLASMKDDNGKVLVEGFYDDVIPLTPFEKEALAKVPAIDEDLKKELGLHTTEMNGTLLAERINLPSLNINGIQSANVGAMAANVIPATATATLDLRLVLGNDYLRQAEKVVRHIRQQGYFVVEREPTDEERLSYAKICKVQVKKGYNAQRTPMDLPLARRVIEAVQKTTNQQVILMPTSGGSLPLYLFEKHLGASAITVSLANYDNNQHAENENLRIGNLWDAIETMAALMLM
ncbi:MAG: M20/M25/M40 family metallo-hydrolase [Cytophagales bacterium]|nr:M20/M25/M40 family metallo-hydrolase [Bernardetiaceae bacterium]MDW8206048.1 M20/M25/M40 family metallo-hydrolase [Cytophagales bacterium]